MGMLCKDKKIVILVFFLKFLKWREYISIRTDKSILASAQINCANANS